MNVILVRLLQGLVFLGMLATSPVWILGLLLFVRVSNHDDEPGNMLARGGGIYRGGMGLTTWDEPEESPPPYLIPHNLESNAARAIALFALADPTDPRVPGEHYIPATRAESSDRAQRILAAIRDRGDNDRL